MSSVGYNAGATTLPGILPARAVTTFGVSDSLVVLERPVAEGHI